MQSEHTLTEIEPPAPKRGRGRPRKAAATADAPSPALAAPQPRPRGRQKGFRLPTFADLDELTLEDFSFVRGVYNGMEIRESFLRFYANIHFDAQGAPEVPHGLSLNARFRHLEDKIVAAATATTEARFLQHAETLTAPLPEQATDQAQRRSLEEIWNEWADKLPDDYYSQAEMLEAFQRYLHENGIEISTQQSNEVSRAAMIESKVKALNELQTALAYRPRQDAATGIWLARPIRAALMRLQVHTMGQLVRYISAAGRNWHRAVARLGAVRAQRLQAWLQDHADTLGRIDQSSPAWQEHKPLKRVIEPLRRAPEVASLTYEAGQQVATPRADQIVQRAGIAPLELLRVPPSLDGSHGLFRAQAPNHFGARNDMEAVRLWLSTFLTAGKTRTFEAYRREVERFYVWCLNEAQVALSGVNTSHALAYQAFLAKIPAAYIGRHGVTRDDARWRPWRGQLTPRSQLYALTVIKVMMEALTKAGYLSANAFDSLKAVATVERTMDTSRSLNRGDLEWAKALLQRHEEVAALSAAKEESAQTFAAAAGKPPALQVARARRLKFLLNMLLTTGVRLEELAKARVADLVPVQPEAGAAPGEFLLQVLGKGKKVRRVLLSATVHQQMTEHHADVEALLAARHGHTSQQLLAFRIERPLVASLSPPPSPAGVNATKRSQSQALSAQGIYRTLKAFFRDGALRGLRGTLAAKAATAKKQKDAGAGARAEEYAALSLELRRLEHDEAMWRRRLQISTHWLRHTFAKEVLRVNPSDTGLKLAQQLLGHANITTTGLYIKQDDTEKIKAARLVFPGGL